MSYSTPEPLCFPPVAGHTVRADCPGGALSSDFGALLLRGIDRQMGLTTRLAVAMQDRRHPSSIDHAWRDLFAQRIYQIASGYADGNDATSLRRDPLFKLGMDRLPLDADQDLARAPTLSRFEHSADRKDLYRLTQALVEHFIASYPTPPPAIVLDLDHTADPTHEQQELAFSHHYYRTYCSLPLFIFEGTSQTLVMACRRPGKRPPGAENARILARLLPYVRCQWPDTPILVRGDSHFATPEGLAAVTHVAHTDFVLGLAANDVLLRQAQPVLHEARRLHQQRCAMAQAHHAPPPASGRLYEEFVDAAAAWAQPWRVVLKAEVMPAGDTPRFVVTALTAPTPQMLYEELSCARGTCENMMKAVQGDLHSARTSDTTCLAHALRLLLACAAYVLHHALRIHTLQHTELAHAQPATVMLTLFKVATLVRPSKDRILLHLPTSCPVKGLLHRVPALLSHLPGPVWHTS